MSQSKIAEYRKRYPNAESLEKVPTTAIVSAYNSLTGKNIKGFHTRGKGIEQFLKFLHDGKTKAATPKAKAKAKAKAKGRAKGKTTTSKRTKYGADRVIRVQVDENPKRPGTLAYDQFRALMACDGKPVQAFLDKEGKSGALDKRPGWPRVELAYCVRAGLVKLEKA